MIVSLLAFGAMHLVETPPERVLLAVLAPPALAANISSADILENFDRVFRELAYVQVVSPEQTGIAASDFDSCPVDVRSSCWVKTALGGGGEHARILVMVSLLPDPKGQAIALVAFDLQRAAAVLRDEHGDERTERAIWSSATRPPTASVASGELRSYFEHRAHAELGALLVSIAPRAAIGGLVLENVAAGAEIELDGKSVGVAPAAIAEIEGVRAGSRRVRVRSPLAGSEPSELTAIVRGGEIARAAVPVIVHQTLSPVLQISLGAIGLVAGGSLIAAHAISTAGDGAYCVHSAASTACDARPPAFQPSSGGVAIPSGDRGAPLTLVLGAGLIAAGAAWSIASWASDDASMWWIVLASLASGAAAATIVVISQ